jgi:Histidine kinase-, DNA gyrase B-, and HSP90-like ATPase
VTPASEALEAGVIGRDTLKPDAAGVLRAISRIGYRLPEAIADLVDNSIDARAATVLIRFFRSGEDLTAIAVVDDGSGMDEKTLHEAMRFGSRTPFGHSDLGKYGMGLKSASLNHANTLSVLTRQSGQVHGRRWTTASIEQDWKLEKLDPADVERLLDQDWDALSTDPSGTVVLWQDMDNFAASPGRAAQRFGQYKRALAAHLGLIFHRFLEEGRLSLVIDLHDLESRATGLPHTVEPLNPFPQRSGHRGYPTTFHLELEPHGDLELTAQIWPPLSVDPGYKLNGRVAEHQGLYFFRNDRLIQAGGWNGWRNDAEPHASLARVSIDLFETFDEAFAINVQKSGVYAPPGFVEAIDAARAGRTTMADYVRTAIEVYRRAGAHIKPRAVIAEGLTRRPLKKLKAILADDHAPTIPTAIRWSRLPEDRVFELGDSEIILNKEYRPVLLFGARGGAGDAPIFKTLLFLLISDDLLHERRSAKANARLELINQCLLIAIEEEERR